VQKLILQDKRNRKNQTIVSRALKNKKLKICITGGSGFVGTRLVDKLLEKGLSISVLTRHANKTFPHGVDVFVGDLSLPGIHIDKFLIGCDVLINCAGETSDLSQMQKIHVEGVERLINAINQARQKNSRPLHFVQLSSVGCYGPAKNPSSPRIILETSEIMPKGIYESTKSLADEIIKKKSSKNLFTYSILRPSNIVGLGMPNRSFGQFLRAIKSKKFFYIGSKSSITSYVHLEDVIDAILICTMDSRAKNQVFNLSNDCALTNIVAKVSNYYGFADNFLCIPESFVRLSVFILSKFIQTPLNKSRVDALVSKTTYPSNKIKDVLGFIPSRSIPEFATEYLKSLYE